MLSKQHGKINASKSTQYVSAMISQYGHHFPSAIEGLRRTSGEHLARLAHVDPLLRRRRSRTGCIHGRDPQPQCSAQDKKYMGLREKFAQKIIDFVAQDRADGSIIAIIELDDQTHDQEKDEKRDAMLASAGYKIVRWHSKDKPDATTISKQLLPTDFSRPPARPTPWSTPPTFEGKRGSPTAYQRSARRVSWVACESAPVGSQ